MSRLPIRARVLRRENSWLVILPSGRRVTYVGTRHGWWLANDYAHMAVRKERRREALEHWERSERVR